MTHPMSPFAFQAHGRSATLGDDGTSALADNFGALLSSAADGIESALDDLSSTLSALSDVRNIVGATGYDSIWTSDVAQNVSDAVAVGKYAVAGLRDAAVGARKTFVQPDGAWAIERLPGDPYSVDSDPKTGIPSLFQNGAVFHPPVSLGAPIAAAAASPVLVPIVAIVGAVLIVGAVMWAVRAYAEAASSAVDRVADAYNKKLMYECLDKHDNKICDDSLATEQRLNVALLEAEAKKKNTISGTDQATVDVVKSGAIGASVLAGAWALSKIIPAVMDDRRQSRAAKALA